MHSQTGDRTGRDKSGHEKKPTERGSLTCWRLHRGTSQDTERKRQSEAHSHTGDRTGRAKSGDRKKPTERGTLTNWRPHREGQVRTRRETERARHTHVLETAQRGTSQDRARNRQSEVHSRTGDRTGRDKSGHRKKKQSETHSQTGDRTGRDKSGHVEKPKERGTLTFWRPHRGTSQDMERNRQNEAHLQTGDRTGRDKSGTRRETNRARQCTLTVWEAHREGQVRTGKETDRARRTHFLGIAKKGTSQDTEKN